MPVVEDSDLKSAELNRAFVLIQYFGYLRRNPHDPQDTDYTGYDFWLTKLKQFNGNFVDSEMVKASSPRSNTASASNREPIALPALNAVSRNSELTLVHRGGVSVGLTFQAVAAVP